MNPVEAAGGILMRRGRTPLFAIVQRRKDNAWVLPKGKLKPRESAVAAARREVVEETGHGARVHEYLGAISYKAGPPPEDRRVLAHAGNNRFHARARARHQDGRMAFARRRSGAPDAAARARVSKRSRSTRGQIDASCRGRAHTAKAGVAGSPRSGPWPTAPIRTRQPRWSFPRRNRPAAKIIQPTRRGRDDGPLNYGVIKTAQRH